MPLSQSHTLALDLRILKMSRNLGPKAYERSLIATQRIYQNGERDAGSFAQNSAPKQPFDAKMTARNLTTITALHRTFIDRKYRSARQPKSVAAQKRSLSRSADHYLKFITDEPESLRIKAQMAKLHGLLAEHQKAVDLYRQLIAASSPAAKKRYMLLAIASQSILADWSTKVEFGKQRVKG